MPNPLRVLQLSDIHLFANHHRELLGVPTQQSFQAVLDKLTNWQEAFDIVIVTGDLSQDGSHPSYHHLAQMLGKLQLPVYYLPGNHDNQDVMHEVYPTGMLSDAKQLLFKHWQFILLDSQIPGSVEGRLDPAQLEFLSTSLTMHPDHHALVLLHHHPVQIGCGWLDPLGLQNADDFFDILKQHPHARHVVFGHIHQALTVMHENIQCMSSPSTCIQFKPESIDFALDFLPPGYRWMRFYDDGKFETGIERIDDYIGEFDSSAGGY